MILTELLKQRFNGLFICFSHSWGGLEQVAASDAIEVAALGLQVQFLCLENTPVYNFLTSYNESRNRLTGDRKVSLVPISFRPQNYFDFGMRRELYQLIDQGVTLIHTHQTSILGSIVPWLWRKRKIALLATRHIMNNHNKKDFFHRLLYSRLDSLIVMSQALRKNVLETHGIREKNVKVVNLGLDFDVFDPDKVSPDEQRAKWGADSETVVIGLVGRIDPAKGQGTFIKAAAGLLKQLRAGEKLKFVIVGEETLGNSNQHLEELKQMVVQFRLDDSVVFTGFQEAIPEIMRSFDICVMPSRQEAFGLVAIEAMAMECPIIISNSGSSSEIVGNEEFGLTIRPDDAFDLQRQIRHLLDHPLERIKMGRKAREHVMTHYDRQKRLIKTLNLYERALRRRKAI